MSRRAIPFHLIGFVTEHLAGKRPAVDVEVKQVVTSFLQTLDASFYYAGVQTVVTQ